MDISLTALCAGVVAAAAPLLFAALGETLTERAGVVNLSLDGAILLSAMAGFVAALKTGSTAAGFASAALCGMMVAGVLAAVGIGLRQSLVAVGFALTFLCRDLAYFLGAPFARTAGPQLSALPVPYLSSLPFAGPVFFEQTIAVYAGFAAIPALWYFLYRTRHGLMVRCAGDNPDGCWARGIRPRLVQAACTVAGGALVGVAGAAYSLSVKPGWGRPQGCEGIGWIALAVVIFGGKYPARVAAGAYLFGGLQVAGILLQDSFPSIPGQIFQAAPFPLMIFTLVVVHFANKRRGVKRNQ